MEVKRETWQIWSFISIYDSSNIFISFTYIRCTFVIAVAFKLYKQRSTLKVRYSTQDTKFSSRSFILYCSYKLYSIQYFQHVLSIRVVLEIVCTVWKFLFYRIMNELVSAAIAREKSIFAKLHTCLPGANFAFSVSQLKTTKCARWLNCYSVVYTVSTIITIIKLQQ